MHCGCPIRIVAFINNNLNFDETSSYRYPWYPRYHGWRRDALRGIISAHSSQRCGHHSHPPQRLCERFSHRVEGGEAGGYQRTEKEIIRSGCPYVSGCKQGEKAGSGRGAYSCHRTCAVSAICKDARHEGGVHASRARL